MLTAFRGNFFTCLLGGVGRAGAGPFFFFHWPSRLALLGLMGVNTVTTHDAGVIAETEVVPTSAPTPLVGGGAGRFFLDGATCFCFFAFGNNFVAFIVIL